MTQQYVFGYGSLVTTHKSENPEQELSFLNGYGRRWGVAMDNRADIPGYKYYRDSHTGERPDIFVAFLDIYPKTGARINGLVVPVSDDELIRLDRREQNYHRINVTDAIEPEIEGILWTYIGKEGAHARYQLGLREGTCNINQKYEQMVRDGFAAYGKQALEDYDQSTEAHSLPALMLDLIKIPE